MSPREKRLQSTASQRAVAVGDVDVGLSARAEQLLQIGETAGWWYRGAGRNRCRRRADAWRRETSSGTVVGPGMLRNSRPWRTVMGISALDVETVRRSGAFDGDERAARDAWRSAISFAYSGERYQSLSAAISGNSMMTRRCGFHSPSSTSNAPPRTMKRPPCFGSAAEPVDGTRHRRSDHGPRRRRSDRRTCGCFLFGR